MESSKQRIRVNHDIRAREVRVIGPDGNQMGVFQVSDAIKRAQEFGLDLVEISPKASPPVCKIIDYGKFKYQLKKKAKETKKNQVVIKMKEIQLRPNINDHDLTTKVNHIKRFLEDGCKVMITVGFSGREMAHMDLGNILLNKVLTAVVEVADIESPVSREGRRLMVIINAKSSKSKKAPETSP